jgi:hypothetical protein
MAKRHMEKMLTNPGYKGNVNQSHTPVRIASIKNTTNNKCWQGWRGKRNPLTLLVGMLASTITLENTMEAS